MQDVSPMSATWFNWRRIVFALACSGPDVPTRAAAASFTRPCESLQTTTTQLLSCLVPSSILIFNMFEGGTAHLWCAVLRGCLRHILSSTIHALDHWICHDLCYFSGKWDSFENTFTSIFHTHRIIIDPCSKVAVLQVLEYSHLSTTKSTLSSVVIWKSILSWHQIPITDGQWRSWCNTNSTLLLQSEHVSSAPEMTRAHR